jgi:hypothetical protein
MCKVKIETVRGTTYEMTLNETAREFSKQFVSLGADGFYIYNDEKTKKTFIFPIRNIERFEVGD